MFYTITEAADKYKVDAFQLGQYLSINFHHVLLNNPDISSTGTDATLISGDKLYGAMSKFLTKDVDLPTSDELAQLQKDAITAMATYFASLNVTSSYDFNMDMRLEGDGAEQFPAAEFMCDGDCLGDFLSDMEQDIYARTAELQKEIALKVIK